MVKLSSVERARSINHLKAAWKQHDVAVLFCVSKTTISKLWFLYRVAHDVKDRPKSGRPRITTARVDRSIRLATLRNRRITARSMQMRYLGRHGRWVYVQTIRNQLNATQLKSRKAVQKPLLTTGVAIEFIWWPVLPVSCGSLLALRGFGKFPLDTTSLLWAISFVETWVQNCTIWLTLSNNWVHWWTVLPVNEMWLTIGTERCWQISDGHHRSSLGRISRGDPDTGTP